VNVDVRLGYHELNCQLIKAYVYGGVEVWLHALLTSALDGGEWSALICKE